MPFPLYALDYGSRRRLRELATPAEAYDLQIAAPHFDGLQPIQKVHDHRSTFTLYTRFYFNDDGQLCVEKFPPKMLNTNELYTIVRNLTIEKFASNHRAQLITDRFIIATQCLTFVNCDLTARLLQDISTKTKTDTRYLNLYSCTFHDDVTLDLICTLFKKLRYLHLESSFLLKRTWINTLNLHNITNMTQIRVNSFTIDLFEVDETQLIEFLKKQSRCFVFYITILKYTDDLEVRQTLDRQFSNRYWHSAEEDINVGRKIVISWWSKGTNHRRYYGLRKFIYCPKALTVYMDRPPKYKPKTNATKTQKTQT